MAGRPLAARSSVSSNTAGPHVVSSSSAPISSAMTTNTVTEVEEEVPPPPPPVLHLVVRPRGRRNVQWTQDTVDNEHMNKKKSKKC
mmetsp:Transcript_55560/g.154785  ORF Transcript_55560/g.154785 Transcript_55560/m.154785 type:complete len:86 (-) Transcript_55560:328-585(-)